MARLILLLLAAGLMPVRPQEPDRQLKEAGVCARCHVISVVEWGMSRHWRVGTNCVSCHGASEGHVADERNNVKPDRLPHGAAIAPMCLGCHTKTKSKADCEKCHHVHALVNPKAQARTANPGESELAKRWRQFDASMAEGERHVQASEWQRARDAFRAALEQKPGDARAAARLHMCERRLKPDVPGFERIATAVDAETGLPREVRVAGAGIAMALVPGGEATLGSESRAGARPVHTVHVDPFYLGKFEVTQAEWRSVMGANPSAHQGAKFSGADRLPVEQVSWSDANQFVARLNGQVPGAGFRLPTEAEWEYAARAGGDGDDALDAAAPRAVGLGLPNKLGIYDLRGNVWEWCSSLLRAYPYDARDGREDAHAEGLRVLRGGGYADIASWVDAVARHSERPDRRLRWVGMRVARAVPE